MRYLSLCTMVRDEAPFIKEWLTYHALIGVEHFFVYDNESSLPVTRLLEGFAGRNTVTVIPWPGDSMQLMAYRDCLEKYGAGSAWLGFIDIDEFVCPLVDDDLRILLSEFEEYGGLAVNWNVFSSAGHLKRPEGPVIGNYTLRFPPRSYHGDIHIKSLVQPQKVLATRNPHFFLYRPPYYYVNEDHFPLFNTSFAYSRHQKVKLNHYFFRSQQDFEKKIAGGCADTGGTRRSLDMFYDHARQAVETDRDILRFLPRVEKALRNDKLPAPIIAAPAPDDYGAGMEQAARYLRNGQFSRAEVLLCALRRIGAEQSGYWAMRSILSVCKDNLDRAERFLRRAAMLDDNATVFKGLAALRKKQGQLEAAGLIENYLSHRMAVTPLFGGGEQEK